MVVEVHEQMAEKNVPCNWLELLSLKREKKLRQKKRKKAGTSKSHEEQNT